MPISFQPHAPKIHVHTADLLVVSGKERNMYRLYYAFLYLLRGAICKHESDLRRSCAAKRERGETPFTVYQYETYLKKLISAGLVRRDDRGFLYPVSQEKYFFGKLARNSAESKLYARIPSQAILSNDDWFKFLAGISNTAIAQTIKSVVPIKEQVRFIAAPVSGGDTRNQSETSDDLPIPAGTIELGAAHPDKHAVMTAGKFKGVVAMSLSFIMARLGCSKATASRIRKASASGGYTTLKEQLSAVHLPGQSGHLRIDKRRDHHFEHDLIQVVGDAACRIRVRKGWVYQQLPSLVSFGEIRFF